MVMASPSTASIELRAVRGSERAPHKRDASIPKETTHARGLRRDDEKREEADRALEGANWTQDWVDAIVSWSGEQTECRREPESSVL